jgi:hypothetical protein
VYSSRFVSEAKTFIWYNGKAKAMRGYNDDLMMSMAIACWVKDTVLTVNQRELQYKKAFLDSIVVTSTNFDTRIAGMIGYDKTNKYMEESVEDNIKPFKWLYKG